MSYGDNVLLLVDATRKRRAVRSLELEACLQSAATDFGEFLCFVSCLCDSGRSA